MYFIYGPMIVMMAYAVRYLLQQPEIRARRIATAMLVVLIGCNGVGIALTGQSSSAYTIFWQVVMPVDGTRWIIMV